MWTGSGLKMESVSTDVAWGRGSYDNKILTSARNGELIMWDLNKLGPSKFERRTRQHLRSIHVLAYSPIVSNYCMTGSADGDIRVWDLRDMRNSVVRLHHPTAVRTAAFSCSQAYPVHAVVGLDNGSLYRYDFSMGSKGQLDRLPVAHSGPILALDWCAPDGGASSGGWVASGSLDRTVKVWDLTGPHFERTPAYTLATQFPIRRVRWRPGYECEIAVASNAEIGACPVSDMSDSGVAEDVDSEKLEVAIPKRRADMRYAVEIWDVRRGYIAKWLVGGSAIEGGVTDIDFRDSHALWAQHSSGTFAQLDLRNSYRPLDAVPRLAASWSVSHTLTFVTDKKPQWELPYDDIDPRTKPPALPSRLKVLGDKPYNPTLQSIGTHVFGHSHHDSHRFSVLAKGYVVEGSDKGKICEINAQIALQAEHHQVFQMWCLLRSLFTPNTTLTSRPPTPPLSPLPLSSSVSLVIPDTPSSDCPAKLHSPYPSSGGSPHPVSSAPASNSPSPQRVSSTTQVTLSPLSATTSPRTSSLFSRRSSNGAFLPNRPRGPTSFRRPSMSTLSIAPNDNSTSARLRHVGEGTLDDSDSSDDSDSDISSLLSTSAVSPTAHTFPRTTLSAAPSPLSRVAAAGHPSWTEDEREVDDDSPSPASTETESEGETARKQIRARSQSLRRRGTGTRSRSSTLAAPPILPPPLQRPGSRSSTRTVTAHDDADHEHFPPTASCTSRVASRVASAGVLSDGLFGSDASDTRDVYVRNEVQRRVEEVREVIRKALQEVLEEYADAGDVQTCAMMAVVASRELGLGRRRVQLFVEAYIELLTRMKLHTTAAYLRKHSVLPEISSLTNLQTTIYVSCGRCRKPIISQRKVRLARPARHLQLGAPSGTVLCTLLNEKAHLQRSYRLPQPSSGKVHALHCGICSHGGHQDCYRRFYEKMPMVFTPHHWHPPPQHHRETPHRLARSTSRSNDGEADDTNALPDCTFDTSTVTPASSGQLLGHPCAAGCGHFCWVTNLREEDTEKP
ncbi:hypothetical protein EI94DRAFT_1848453 [Lactarius quietus]|nr:hypothetical protein EI94DRAFT_1848453 [Lactarius quietus]